MLKLKDSSEYASGNPYLDGYDQNDEDQVAVYEPPFGHVVDELGRLLLDPRGMVDPEILPEDNLDLYVSRWQPQFHSKPMDFGWTSKVVWPDVAFVVLLKRLDIYEQLSPKLQIGTTDLADSRALRNDPAYFPVRSIYSVNFKNDLTIDFHVESTGPPRRSKFRPAKKTNARDLCSWVIMDTIQVFYGVPGCPGTVLLYIDYMDFPDRYFLTSTMEPAIGCRRLFQYGGYAVTQYFIVEKFLQHESLISEGGFGYTYLIVKGPICYARKDYRLIGSFFAFDAQLPGSSLYKVYHRNDPFPRMMISRDITIHHAEEWNIDYPLLSFYAFDVPIPGSIRYSLQHSIRSIYTNVASIPRHRLVTTDPKQPWEFRMNLYMMSAELADCRIEPFPYQDDNGGGYEGGQQQLTAAGYSPYSTNGGGGPATGGMLTGMRTSATTTPATPSSNTNNQQQSKSRK